MGASAESKLARAQLLHKQANNIRKWDADGAAKLDDAARRQNRAAAKQMRGGKRKTTKTRMLGRP